MRRNITAMGERSIQGEYGFVRAAGELKVEDSTIRHLSAAGEVVMTRSRVKKASVAGELAAEASEFEKLKVMGEAQLKGICKAGVCSVTGTLKAELLESAILCNIDDGKRRSHGHTLRWETQPNGRETQLNSGETQPYGWETQPIGWAGVFHAVTFENTGAQTMNYEYRFQNIINTGILRSGLEINCESFYSLGQLSAAAVNAEHIFLLNGDPVTAGQLTGASVEIKNVFRPDEQFKRIPKSLSYPGRKGEKGIIAVDVIEADNIELEHTKARLVSGGKVTIGELCIIERVEYRESIQIHHKAVVNEVIKL